LTDFASLPVTPLSQKGFPWRLESPVTLGLLEKMKKAGKPLGKYANGKIYRGVVSGLNEAFVIDGATRRALIAESPKAAEIIKPYLGGKHIRKWVCERPDQWMLYLPHGVITKGLDSVIEHLRPYRKQLEERATEQAWYELQQPQEKFTEAYAAEKLVFPDISSEVRFAYDPTGAYPTNTAYGIPSKDFFLLGVLNSTAVEFFYTHLSCQIRGGYLRFIYQYVEQIPIPEASAGERAAVAGLVERVLAASRRGRADPPSLSASYGETRPPSRGATADKSAAAVAALEQEIDARVYRLYGLTKDEIKLVEDGVRR